MFWTALQRLLSETRAAHPALVVPAQWLVTLSAVGPAAHTVASVRRATSASAIRIAVRAFSIILAKRGIYVVSRKGVFNSAFPTAGPIKYAESPPALTIPN